MKIFLKLKNKVRRNLRRFAAWILVKLAKTNMKEFGWESLRWLEDAGGMYLMYYVCKEFPMPKDFPPADNVITVKNGGGPRCNANKEANQPSRRSDSSTVEDIQTVPHPSPAENRDRHSRTVPNQGCGIQHKNKPHYPSQC